MAQNRKARTSEEPDLMDAVTSAEERLRKAAEAYGESASIRRLRNLQVATDELKALRTELRSYDRDRDPEAVRRADASPRRNRSSWPVGAPEKPLSDVRKSRQTAEPKPDRTPNLPPPTARPAILDSRKVPPTRPGARPERLSWWVGADRSRLNSGAQALATAPVAPTARPASKAAVKTAKQHAADAQRDARDVSGKLQEKLQPTAGAFTSIPVME
jgi:hypothetical protein